MRAIQKQKTNLILILIKSQIENKIKYDHNYSLKILKFNNILILNQIKKSSKMKIRGNFI